MGGGRQSTTGAFSRVFWHHNKPMWRTQLICVKLVILKQWFTKWRSDDCPGDRESNSDRLPRPTLKADANFFILSFSVNVQLRTLERGDSRRLFPKSGNHLQKKSSVSLIKQNDDDGSVFEATDNASNCEGGREGGGEGFERKHFQWCWSIYSLTCLSLIWFGLIFCDQRFF